MRAFLGGIVGVVLALTCSCSDNPETGTGGTGGGDTGGTGGGDTGGTGGGDTGGTGGGFTLDCDPQADPPPLPADDWCERIRPGGPGSNAIAMDLSKAHAAVRFFGPVTEYADADNALVAALLPETALTDPDLGAYADLLPGRTCAAAAEPLASPLGASSFDVLDGTVLVHPGLGSIAIPDGAKAVVVDLRGLPDVPELRAVLEAAIAPALASPVPRPKARVRKHYGMTDELFSPANIYKNTISEVTRPPIPAAGTADLPLALLTEPKMPPDAVDVAAALRVANRAYLVGEGLRVEVAEARWQGIGSKGLAYRQADLIDVDGNRLPDEIPADYRMAEPACIANDLASLGLPSPIADSPPARPAIEHIDPFGKKQAADIDLGVARAALVSAHASVRTFFPLFGQVDDTIDARLSETLTSVGAQAPARQDLRNLLRRFGNSLDDAHNIIRDFAGPKYKSFPCYIEDIDGEAVVRQTLAVGVEPGDTITKIGGVPAADWYQNELARTSAATDHYRFLVASFEYLRLENPTQFELRDPDGNTKTIDFQPQPLLDLAIIGFSPEQRPAGWLTDVGAPELYYINLSGDVLYDQSEFDAALTEAETSSGLVLDMRAYPGIDLSLVARRIIPDSFSGTIFRVPVLTGLEESEIDEYSDTFDPLDMPSYGGPVVLLVGHGTLSAAEHFSMALVNAGRVTVAGRQSAGTNGNITAIQLPGSFAFSFTGMDVRWDDASKSLFHGIGIVPDIEVPLTAAAFRDGIDPELQAAVTYLLTN